MDFRILGPLEVSDEGRPLPLGGRQQRLLLAVLLLHANEVVSDDLLLDAIWSESPPPTATNTLRVYVSKLRRVLGADGSGRVVTRPPGYSLNVKPEELDVALFERLLEEGKRVLADGDPETASARLAEALALWRGPALPEFAYVDVAQREISRLDELRMEALEGRIDADLACARHAHLVGELAALIAEYPLRERLRRQQMLALYRSGRQAEALQAYQDARRTFVDEVGIEPTPALKQLQQRMLQQDPSLELDGRPREPTRQRAVGERPRRRRRAVTWIAVGLVAAGVAAAAATAVFAGHGGARTNDALRIAPIGSGLAIALDPQTGRVVGRVRVTSPTAIAAGAGAVWITSYYGRTVSRLDARTHELVDTIGLSGRPTDVIFAGGAVWVVLSAPARTLSRIDPATDSVTKSIRVKQLAPKWIDRLAHEPLRLAAGAGSIWVSDPPTTVLRIDPSTARVVARMGFLNPPRLLAASSDAVWVGHTDGTLSRIDPQTNSVDATAQAGSAWLANVAVTGHSVWVASPTTDQVWRLDPVTRRAYTAVGVAGRPSALAVGGGIWVGSKTSGTLSRIDDKTNRVVQRIETGGAPVDLVLTRGQLWVALDTSKGASRLTDNIPY